MRAPFSFTDNVVVYPTIADISLFTGTVSFPTLVTSVMKEVPVVPAVTIAEVSSSNYLTASDDPSVPLAALASESFVLSFGSFTLSSFRATTDFNLGSLVYFSEESVLFPTTDTMASESPFILAVSGIYIPVSPISPGVTVFFVMAFCLCSTFVLRSAGL